MNGTVLLIACVLGVIPGLIAKSKGRNFWLWWLYGAALFIVALVHSLLLKPDQEAEDSVRLKAGGRRCPFCAEIVRREAIVCRYCGRDIPELASDAVEELASCESLLAAYGAWRESKRASDLTDFVLVLQRALQGHDGWISEAVLREAFPDASGIPEFEDLVLRQ